MKLISSEGMVAYQRKFDELLGPHIVVAGFITAATIKMFLREYFHEVIAMRMNRTVVVIVGRDNPDAAIVEILNEPNLRHFLQVLNLSTPFCIFLFNSVPCLVHQR